MSLATADMFQAEIAKLQGDLEAMRLQRDAARRERFALTDAEREVIEAILVDPDSAPGASAATLRGLLERTAEK